MDPLTHLYARLPEQSPLDRSRFEEPPRFEEWLRCWNDDDTDLANLRNFEHWLLEARRHHRAPP